MSEPIRVVLIDDQQLFRSGLAVIIDAQPDMVVVGQASDGGDGIDVIDATTPDVVLMDVRMAPVDGVEATRRIFSPERAALRSRLPRVIVLTTFSLDDRAALAIRYGASGFLLKDSTPEFLCAAIRTVHAGNAVLAPSDLSLLMDGSFRNPVPAPAAFSTLTEREREVFNAVAAGLNNAEIAAQEFLSESTVKTHIGSILRKLSLRDRVQIVVYAHKHDLHE